MADGARLSAIATIAAGPQVLARRGSCDSDMFSGRVGAGTWRRFKTGGACFGFGKVDSTRKLGGAGLGGGEAGAAPNNGGGDFTFGCGPFGAGLGGSAFDGGASLSTTGLSVISSLSGIDSIGTGFDAARVMRLGLVLTR